MTTKPALAVGAALLTLTGCSAAQNVAGDAADAAKERAAQEASSAVSSVVQDQICRVVGDSRLSDRLSDSDISTLSNLLDQADAAGLDSEVLQPLRDIASTGEAKASDVQALQDSCA